MRVLVVDDEEVMQRVIRRALGAAGHETHSVTSAAAAREACSPEPDAPVPRFDAAVIDVHIARNDGIELGRELLERRHVARVVFFTGTIDPGLLRAAARIGAVVHKGSGSLGDVVAALEAA